MTHHTSPLNRWLIAAIVASVPVLTRCGGNFEHAPVFTVQPTAGKPKPGPKGDVYTLTVKTIANPSETKYLWYVDGQAKKEATEDTFSFPVPKAKPPVDPSEDDKDPDKDEEGEGDEDDLLAAWRGKKGPHGDPSKPDKTYEIYVEATNTIGTAKSNVVTLPPKPKDPDKPKPKDPDKPKPKPPTDPNKPKDPDKPKPKDPDKPKPKDPDKPKPPTDPNKPKDKKGS